MAAAAVRPRSGYGRAAWLLAALALAALGRGALNGHSAATAFAAGSVFGVALVVASWAGGWRPARPRLAGIGLGILGGLALVAVTWLAHPLLAAVVGMRPEPFAAWVLVTAIVVIGEEALLRGALFDALEGAGGPISAVLLTSLAFALMHVPLYGWQVVPLDAAVGIWFGGLRLASGGIAVPAVAHLLADLATWWP